MFIELTADQRALREELRRYLRAFLTPEERAALREEPFGRVYRDAVRRLGSDGWLAIGSSVADHGFGWGAEEQHLLHSEAVRADVPYPFLTLHTIAPVIERFGTWEQQRTLLPAIAAGDLHVAVDRATGLRAERDGEHYVVTGRPELVSGAADLLWLACTTNAAVPRESGTSVLLVAADSPGVHDTGYDGVRVPAAMRVGAENEGWAVLRAQAGYWQLGVAPTALLDRVLGEVAAMPGPDGAAVATRPDVRRVLGELRAHLLVSEAVTWHAVSSGAGAGASARLRTSGYRRAAGRLNEIIATYGDLADPATRHVAVRLDEALVRADQAFAGFE